MDLRPCQVRTRRDQQQDKGENGQEIVSGPVPNGQPQEDEQMDSENSQQKNKK